MPGLCPKSWFSPANTAKPGKTFAHNPAQLPKDRSEAWKSRDFPRPAKAAYFPLVRRFEQIENTCLRGGEWQTGLRISGLNELRERLERLRPEEVMARALATQAERIADAVRHNLSDPPGSGEHDQPWLQTGALHDSVGATADGLHAAVGSSDPAAVPQEMGTAHTPPRPFLAPVASGMGEEAARGVAEAVVAALMGEPEGGAVILAGASSSGQTHSVPYDPLGVFVPGSPENEDWTHETLRRFQGLGRIFRSERGDDAEGVQKPPSGSKPIDQTPWSGDHAAIKGDIGAKPDDDTRISPTATCGAKIQMALGPIMVRQAASPARAARVGGAAKTGSE